MSITVFWIPLSPPSESLDHEGDLGISWITLRLASFATGNLLSSKNICKQFPRLPLPAPVHNEVSFVRLRNAEIGSWMVVTPASLLPHLEGGGGGWFLMQVLLSFISSECDPHAFYASLLLPWSALGRLRKESKNVSIQPLSSFQADILLPWLLFS